MPPDPQVSKLTMWPAETSLVQQLLQLTSGRGLFLREIDNGTCMMPLAYMSALITTGGSVPE